MILLALGAIFAVFFFFVATCCKSDGKAPIEVRVRVIEPAVVKPEPIVVAKKKSKPEWFISDWAKTLKPSAAESLIIAELNVYEVKWYREVSFTDLQIGSSYPRYDFYIPFHNLIIEYDGKDWHSDPDRIIVDEIKNQYCKTNNIEMVRYNAKHYYKIPYEISRLMNGHSIHKKM